MTSNSVGFVGSLAATVSVEGMEEEVVTALTAEPGMSLSSAGGTEDVPLAAVRRDVPKKVGSTM